MQIQSLFNLSCSSDKLVVQNVTLSHMFFYSRIIFEDCHRNVHFLFFVKMSFKMFLFFADLLIYFQEYNFICAWSNHHWSCLYPPLDYTQIC